MKRLLRVIIDFGNRMKEDNLNAYASGSAFFIFLSLIPFMILVCSIIPYTPIKEEDVLFILTSNFTGVYSKTFEAVIEDVYARSFGVTIIALISTLWSAGKGVNSIITGLNAIDHRVDRRNGLLLRFISSLYTLILMLGIIFIMIIMVYGRTLYNFFKELFPKAEPILTHLINVRGILAFAILTFVIILCYSLLPVQKMRFRDEVPGAIFTSLSWMGFSYLFAFYIERYNPFSMYGNFTVIIILLIWLYFLMYFLFVGAHLNRYFRPVFLVFSKRRTMKSEKAQMESLEED